MASEDDVFDALSNEIRRKIIVLLAERPRSYAELMKELNLDSPALAFHLKKLGSLIQKDNGNYTLTELGKKAYALLQQLKGEATIPERKRKSLIEKITEGITGIVSEVADLDISSKLTTVYDSTIPLKKKLSVELDGGVIEIKPGDPHLLAKCHFSDDLDINEQGDELRIRGDGCKLFVTYPEALELINVEVDGGVIDVSGMEPKSFNLSLDGGVIKGEFNNFLSGSVSVDGGTIKLNVRPQVNGKLDINMDGGTAHINLGLPEGVGVIVDSSRINGGALRNNIRELGGEKGYVIIRLSIDGGLVTIDKLT